MKPATELPWKVYPSDNDQMPFRIEGAQDGIWWPAAEITAVDKSEANAAYIVHACNLYPQLVEALTEAADYMGEQNHPEETLTKARRVLAQCGIVGTPLERAMLPQCEEE